jgi:hypothetical protein
LRGRWIVDEERPDGWAALIRSCGGGFFHAPPALLVGAPKGTPVFATLKPDDRVVGIAMGVKAPCRLSARPRHYYFPTLPAFEDRSAPMEATAALAHGLGEVGAAQVGFDSFDAQWMPDRAAARGRRGRPRQEHVVELAAGTDPESGFAKTHRRHLRRGNRAGWRVRCLCGEAAAAALEQVQGSTGARATALGRGFSPRVPRDAALGSAGSVAGDWGAATFAARDGDALLAAALVGFSNRAGFYVAGGSTPEGFKASAAVWLQWQIMQTLRQHGYVTYNLGGTPVTAGNRGDPANGLFRFKTGFGAEPRPRAGVDWMCSGWHAAMHRVVGIARGGR